MKNILKQEDLNMIKGICDQYGIVNHDIHRDGTVDVDDDVYLANFNLIKLPLKFGRVSGSFWCNDNKLNLLKGAPVFVGENFNCSGNGLASLEGSPMEIGGSLYCYNNKLSDLRGCTPLIGESLMCSNNYLTSLEGAPSKVGGIKCTMNSLVTLEHCPMITGEFVCSFGSNKFPQFVADELGKFENNQMISAFMKYQNHYEVWNKNNDKGLNPDIFWELINDIKEGLL